MLSLTLRETARLPALTDRSHTAATPQSLEPLIPLNRSVQTLQRRPAFFSSYSDSVPYCSEKKREGERGKRCQDRFDNRIKTKICSEINLSFFNFPHRSLFATTAKKEEEELVFPFAFHSVPSHTLSSFRHLSSSPFCHHNPGLN